MLEPGQPCTYCGVRPDIACRHREAVERVIVVLEEDTDLRRTPGRYISNGHNFRAKPHVAKAPVIPEGVPTTEAELLEYLQDGPCWARTLGHMKRTYTRMINKGLIERCKPKGGAANNMLRLVEKSK